MAASTSTATPARSSARASPGGYCYCASAGGSARKSGAGRDGSTSRTSGCPTRRRTTITSRGGEPRSSITSRRSERCRMDAIRLIAEAVPDDGVPALPEPARPGICCVTGVGGERIHRRDVLTSSFRQGDLLRRPGSDGIGVWVWRAWMYGERRPGKKRDYRPERMSCWRATASRFEALDRDGVREALFAEPPGEPWAGYITDSYKKHGSLLAPVNHNG